MTVHTNCEGISRRDCLQLGLGSLVGGGLVSALRFRGLSAADGANLRGASDTSCVFIWLDGGPTHYETFDPKPEAPDDIRGEYETIPTKTPGVRFSKHMKRLAAIQDKIAVIRSIRHNHGNHGAGNHYMVTGAPTRIPVSCGAFVSFHPSMGAMTAYARGTKGALPAYFAMPRMSRSGGPNFLGAKYAPFAVPDDPNTDGFQVRDVGLPSGLDGPRFVNRRQIRQGIDTLLRITEKSAGDPVNALDDYYTQGYNLVTSTEAQEAFDISREPERVREQYGRNDFGQRCLLARRLVEAGVPFVTIRSGGWDHHGGIFKMCDKQLPPLDRAVSALIEDLEQRGRLDKTLIVVLGEFGRTPKINKSAGRDHWSNAMAVMMAGCRTPGGQIVGSTDKHGYAAFERVLSPESFVSTVYTKLGIDPGQILYTPEGRPVHLVSDPTPIRELL